VIHNFNADGFDSLYPRYRGGHSPKFTLPQRREIKKIAKTRPAEHGLPFSTWSLSKLAEFLVAVGVVDDISHEGLRILLREEGVTFQRLKTWKGSTDSEFAAKKARVERLYAIADGEAEPREGEPEVVVCLDEFGAAQSTTEARSAVGRDQRQRERIWSRTAPAHACDVQPHRRSPAPVRRLRPRQRRALRAHQIPQDPHQVP